MKKFFLFILSLMAFASGYAQPGASPTTPPARTAGDFVSVYSDAYTTGITGLGFSSSSDFTPSGGNVCKFFSSSSNGQFTFNSTAAAASMTFLHIDVYSTNANAAQVKIQVGGSLSPNQVTANNQWTSLDVPVASFSGGFGSVSLIGIQPFAGPGNFYIDNVYFWKPATNPALPVLTTPTVTVTGPNSATLGANITSAGTSAPLTFRGTAWKATSPVLAADNQLADGSTTTGVFTQARTGFAAQTQYFYVGYATNSSGTSISPEGNFRTLSNPPTVQSGSFSATPGSLSLTANWGAATFPGSGATIKGYLVIYTTGTPSLTSVNGTAPTAVGTIVNINTSGTPAVTTTISGLTGGSLYNLLLIPYTWDGSNAATYNYLTSGALTTSGTPTSLAGPNAPPNRVATDVVSVYSDSYTTGVTGLGFSSSTTPSLSGNPAKLFTSSSNGQFTFNSTTAAASMTFLHIDIYTTNANSAQVKIQVGGLLSANQLTPNGQWTSLNIPASTYTGGYGSVALIGIQPFAGPGTFYVDNVYFFRLPPAATVTSFTSGCAGQTSVTITGTNFTGASAVTIGGVAVSSFVVNNDTTITATIVPGTSGTIAVTGLGGIGTSTGTFSNIIPTVPTATMASNNTNTALAKSGDVITLPFTTSVTPVGTPTVTIAGVAATVTGSGTSWSASRTVTGGDTNGSAAFSISYLNAVGCTGSRTTVTSGSAVTIDTLAPTFPSVTIASNNANTAVAGTGDVITLSFTTSEALSGTPNVTINGASATVSGSGTSWSAAQTVASCSGSVTTFLISLSDVVGNATTRSTTTNGSQVSINPTPTATIASNNSPSCSGFSAIFTVIGSSGATLNYTITGQALPQQLLLTGINQTINAPNATSDVTLTLTSVVNANCSSSTFATGTSTVTVNPLPAPPTISAGGPTTFCSGLNVVLTSSAASGYLWSNGETTQSITVSTGGDYSVRAINSFGCLGTSSATTTVTVTAQPSWYLDADNDLYYTGAAVVQCDSPGAGYTTATLNGGGDCADGNAAINPGITEVCWNNVDDNCNTTLSEGCTPVVVTMNPSYNNTTLASLAIAIPALPYSYLSETNLKYRFTITNTTTNAPAVEVTQTSRFVTIPGSLYSSPGTYTITASAVINEEVVPYAGNTITVNGPTIPKITLASVSCGATLASLTSTLTANAGQNATGYIFRIRAVDGVVYATSSSSTRFVSANSFAGFPLSYATSYLVSVQYTYNDPVTSAPLESGYGAECIITTPGIPTTTIASPTCGGTVAALNAGISAAAAPYATGYQFRIRLTSNVGGPYIEAAPVASRFSSLTGFGTLQYNSSYSISVRYSVVNNSVTSWSNYGPECIVNTPNLPTTQLVPSQCGQTAATTLTQQLNIVAYPGFPIYRVKLTEVIGEDLGASQEITTSYSYFRLNQFSIAQDGKEYNVEVAIKQGSVFGPYSTVCDIHTPEITKTVQMPFKAVAYPNPFANNFMLDVKTTSQSVVNLKVYDMVGRLIEQRDVRVSDLETTTIGDQYPTGVYNVVVSQEDSLETVRVVKR